MAGAVTQHFDNHAEAWSNVSIVATGVAKVRFTMDVINTVILKQNENNPTGYTASKERTGEPQKTGAYL
jgi:hypothetical protein